MKKTSKERKIWVTLFDDDDNAYEGDFMNNDKDMPRIYISLLYSLTLKDLKNDPTLLKSKHIISTFPRPDIKIFEQAKPDMPIDSEEELKKIVNPRISQSETHIIKFPEICNSNIVKKDSTVSEQEKEIPKSMPKQISFPRKNKNMKFKRDKQISNNSDNIPIKNADQTNLASNQFQPIKIIVTDLIENSKIEASKQYENQAENIVFKEDFKSRLENKEISKNTEINEKIEEEFHELQREISDIKFSDYNFKRDNIKSDNETKIKFGKTQAYIHKETQRIFNQEKNNLRGDESSLKNLRSSNNKFFLKFIPTLKEKNEEILIKIISIESEVEKSLKKYNENKLNFNQIEMTFSQANFPETEKEVNLKSILSNLQKEEAASSQNSQSLLSKCNLLIKELIDVNKKFQKDITEFQKKEEEFNQSSSLKRMDEMNNAIYEKNKISKELEINLLKIYRDIEKLNLNKESLKLTINMLENSYKKMADEIINLKSKSNFEFQQKESELKNTIKTYKESLEMKESEKNETLMKIKTHEYAFIKDAKIPNEKILDFFNIISQKKDLAGKGINEYLRTKKEEINFENEISEYNNTNNDLISKEHSLNNANLNYENAKLKNKQFEELKSEIDKYLDIYKCFENNDLNTNVSQLKENSNKLIVKLKGIEDSINKLNNQADDTKNLIIGKENDINNYSNDLKNLEEMNKNLLYSKNENEKEILRLASETNDKIVIKSKKEKELALKENLIQNQEIENNLKDSEIKNSEEIIFKIQQDRYQIDNNIVSISSKIKSIGEIVSNLKKEKEELLKEIILKDIELEGLRDTPFTEGKGDTRYIPESSDQVDQIFADYMNQLKIPVNLKRLNSGQYMFGSKKIMAKIQNEKLIIRVGGGYMLVDEFLSAYTAQELAKIQVEERATESIT